MAETTTTLDPFGAIRRRPGMVAGFSLVLVVLTYLGLQSLTPQYRSEATVAIRPLWASPADAAETTEADAWRSFYRTQAMLLTSRTVLDQAIAGFPADVEGFSGPEGPSALASHLQVVAEYDSYLIRLVVQDPDPERAAFLANAVADAFVATHRGRAIDSIDAMLQDLRQQQDQDGVKGGAGLQASIVDLQLRRVQAGHEVQLVDRAVPTPSPVNPQVPFKLVLAACLGVLGGTIVALMMERKSSPSTASPIV